MRTTALVVPYSARISLIFLREAGERRRLTCFIVPPVSVSGTSPPTDHSRSMAISVAVVIVPYSFASETNLALVSRSNRILICFFCNGVLLCVELSCVVCPLGDIPFSYSQTDTTILGDSGICLRVWLVLADYSIVVP